MTRHGTATFASALLLAGTLPAAAGLLQWTAEVEKDPFTKSEKVTIDISTSLRSGIVLFCESGKDGLRIRAVPGFAFDSRLSGFSPDMKFAVDGEMVASAIGSTGSVGDNLASAEAELTGSHARNFARAFAKAKTQIAIQDGISDQPHLLKTRGSTKAGSSLLACMRKQPGWIDG